MRKFTVSFLLALAFLLVPCLAFADNLTAESTDCSVSASCMVLDNLNTQAGIVMVQVTGTFSATGVFEMTLGEGSSRTWVGGVLAYPIGGGGAVSSFTGTGIWQIPVGGARGLRIRTDDYVSGTVVALMRAGFTLPDPATGRLYSWDGDSWERVTPSDAGFGAPGSATTRFVEAYGTPIPYVSLGATEDEFAVCTQACMIKFVATNTAATVSYIRCNNDTTANTTPATETLVKDGGTLTLSLAIPGATTGDGIKLDTWAYFSTAASCYLVKGAAISDVAEVGANEVQVLYSRIQ